MERKRVVVTGLGTVNPLGNNVDDFWAAMKAGQCGIGPITRFDTADFDAKVAGEVKGFDPSLWMDKKDARKMALFAQYAVASSVQAWNDAGMSAEAYDPARIGIYMGNGIGGIEVFEESYKKELEQGPRRMPPLTVPLMIMNEAAGNIALRLGIHGPAITVATACASGTDSIGQAFEAVSSGFVDCALAGGTEATIGPFAIGAFCVLKALSTSYNDRPGKASRPFDKDRDGFVMSEGAGMIMLESLESAVKRGARIYAEVAGYGASTDAYHLTAPDPDGIPGAKAVKAALDRAGLEPGDIDYYNAHGTSTPVNDPSETRMLKRAFGDHAYRMKVSSTKSMTGHLVAAAGAVEAIVCILAMRDSFYPPTINLDNPDPECDLDYVPNKGVEGEINACMSGSLGFGGHNAVLAFRKVAP